MTFKSDFESFYGIDDSSDRIAFTERFLNACTIDEYTILNNQYPNLFNECPRLFVVDTINRQYGFDKPNQSPNDIRTVCETMRRASEIYSLIHSVEDISDSDLRRCGISPVFTSLDAADTNYALSYMQEIDSDNYRDWLLRAIETVNGRFPVLPISMRLRGNYLCNSSELKPVTGKDEQRESCAYILQQLITLHLSDVATVCDNTTLHPVQTAYSGISSLWLGLVERMSGGRSFRCEACGKPSIVFGERRRKRFCCEACKKWKNKHPNEMRGYWYYEQRQYPIRPNQK